MSYDVLNTLAQAATNPLPCLPRAWLVTVAALLIAWLGRRRLPVGVSQGLFVSALSAALAVAYAPSLDPDGWPLGLCTLLTSLAVLWHLAIRWVERESPTRRDASPPIAGLTAARLADRAASARRLVGAHAVLLCGLLSAGVSLLVPEAAPRPQRLGVTLCLVILLALAVRRYLDRAAPLAHLAALSLAGCALRLWAPFASAAQHVGTLVLILVALTAAALLVVVAAILGHWRHRRRVWRTEPERLLEPPPEHRGSFTLVLLACSLVGVGALFVPYSLPIPLIVAITGIVALTIAHRWQAAGSPAELGLALIGAAVILAAAAWLPTSGVNALLGTTLAALFLLWLPRFWQQQLYQGDAWTTAGRLIPVARRLGYAATGVCVALAASALAPRDFSNFAVWPAIASAVLLLLLASMLVHEAETQSSVLPGFLACPALLAVLVPLQHVLAHFGAPCPWPVLIAYAAIVLALRVGSSQTGRSFDIAYNAYVGAIAPVLALYLLVFPPADMYHWPAILGTVFGLAGAIALRWRPRRRVGTLTA